jgi:hypothetical protein
MSDQNTSFGSDLLSGYTSEDQMALARGVSTRTLRAERQRGDGPPWTKMGKQVIYPDDGFREWLKSNTRRPTRAGRGGRAA